MKVRRLPSPIFSLITLTCFLFNSTLSVAGGASEFSAELGSEDSETKHEVDLSELQLANDRDPYKILIQSWGGDYRYEQKSWNELQEKKLSYSAVLKAVSEGQEAENKFREELAQTNSAANLDPEQVVFNNHMKKALSLGSTDLINEMKLIEENEAYFLEKIERSKKMTKEKIKDIEISGIEVMNYSDGTVVVKRKWQRLESLTIGLLRMEAFDVKVVSGRLFILAKNEFSEKGQKVYFLDFNYYLDDLKELNHIPVFSLTLKNTQEVTKIQVEGNDLIFGEEKIEAEKIAAISRTQQACLLEMLKVSGPLLAISKNLMKDSARQNLDEQIDTALAIAQLQKHIKYESAGSMLLYLMSLGRSVFLDPMLLVPTKIMKIYKTVYSHFDVFYASGALVAIYTVDQLFLKGILAQLLFEASEMLRTNLRNISGQMFDSLKSGNIIKAYPAFETAKGLGAIFAVLVTTSLTTAFAERIAPWLAYFNTRRINQITLYVQKAIGEKPGHLEMFREWIISNERIRQYIDIHAKIPDSQYTRDHYPIYAHTEIEEMMVARAIIERRKDKKPNEQQGILPALTDDQRRFYEETKNIGLREGLRNLFKPGFR